MIEWVLILGVLMVAIFSRRHKTLTFSGMWAAIIVGVLIALGLGIGGLVLLAVFFGSSAFWGGRESDISNREAVTEKGGERDAWQVLANGGPAALCALFVWIWPEFSLMWTSAFVGSLAAATADTWATEIGSKSRQRPFHILTRKRVSRGVSGAVTSLGIAAAFAGSFLISAIAIMLWWSSLSGAHIWLMVFTAIGFLANLVDTLVGASLQVVYRCPVCGQFTERTTHCGVPSERVKGRSFVNNDFVNVTCTLAGAFLGAIVGTRF
ncbi:DUF92 domain-containing protein [Shouchella shacheensis]|uniref:DUF92 domain-containing protein n=1 Tax=Shouchella shacheensis TaxID=1649580 RepID=UPI00074014BC|nr:DUF92 domain-containing protein [Shouchella shacheensis]